MKLLYSAMYQDDGFPFDALVQGPTIPVYDPAELTEVDSALVLWGGADISPAYYNHPQHHTTWANSKRDGPEWALLHGAIDKGIPIIGVCRGAQMLCAAAGGFLIQNVHNHAGHHQVVTHDSKYFRVNSIHHQMMAGLEKVDHELVAWRPKERGFDNTIKHAGQPYGYMDDKVYEPDDTWREPEFVYFPKINGYAIQWHPEAMPLACEATKYILNYITQKEKSRGYAEICCTC